MKSTLFAAAIALASALSPRAQAPAQIVDATLDTLGGNWVTSESGDLAASNPGDVLTYSWSDTTGLSEVEIVVRINWRHYAAARRCAILLNNIPQADLEEDRLLEAQADSFHAAEYLIRVSEGAYLSNVDNEFVLMMTDDSGGSVSVCQPEGQAYALQFQIQAAGTRDADAEMQMIDAALADFETDFIDSDRDGSDLTATEKGRSLSFSWNDELGHAGIVELSVEIRWSLYRDVLLDAYMNGVLLGTLDQPVTFEYRHDVFYPTIHHFRVPEGAYLPNGLNRFRLEVSAVTSTLGGEVAICEPPGQAVAMRFFVSPYVAEEVHQNAPAAPQAIVLMDATTGTVFRTGAIIDSPDLRIVAVLADPDGNSSALEIEYRLAGTSESGVFKIESQQFAPGTQVTVELPALGPGVWILRVRAVDSTGAASSWVPVETAIHVGAFGVPERHLGVDRDEVQARPQPIPDPIIIDVPGRGSSGGGSCSAGAGSAHDLVLIGMAAMLFLGAARRRM